jgi:hypothetical protein
MTNYLRFADQSAWEAAGEAAGFRINNAAPSEADPEILEDRYTWLYYTHDWSIDDIGIIYNNDAIIDPDTGEVTSPATPMEGWHVNFIGTLPEGWDEYLVAPRNPRRVFA